MFTTAMVIAFTMMVIIIMHPVMHTPMMLVFIGEAGGSQAETACQ
jgi:hypothetical protein